MASPLPILIDTREQRPFMFPAERFTTVRGTLRTGDYSIVGLEDRVCLERKSIGDLVQTLIHDALRFRKELVRMSGFDVAAIVVECNVDDIKAKRYESEANPESVLGKVHAIHFDHGIPVFFWGPRTTCEQMVWQYLTLAAKKVGMP